jgi:hypothetical protein
MVGCIGIAWGQVYTYSNIFSKLIPGWWEHICVKIWIFAESVTGSPLNLLEIFFPANWS